MEIIPNGTIHFLKNIPLDPTYENTIFFEDEASQQAYFQSQVITGSQGIYYNVDNSNYVRLTAGKIKVKTIAEVINTCNYCFFRNSVTVVDFDEGNQPQDIDFKWIYAFVTNVNYINFGTAEVEFEIDLMQTYMFNYRLGACLVEREHTTTDNANPNNGTITPELFIDEDIGTGEFEYKLMGDTEGHPLFYDLKTYDIVMWLGYLVPTTTSGSQSDYWYTQDGVDYYFDFPPLAPWTAYVPTFSIHDMPINVFIYRFTRDAEGLNRVMKLLGALSDKGLTDKIHCITFYPKALLDQIQPYTGHPLFILSQQAGLSLVPYAKYIPKTQAYSNPYTNYTPKNNKLYMYPFNSMVINNGCGNEGEFKFEMFDTSVNSFLLQILYEFSPVPTLYCSPAGYEGNLSFNVRNAISLNGYKQIVWASGYLNEWIAQHTGQLMSQSLGLGLNSISSALIGQTHAANVLGHASLIGNGMIDRARDNYGVGSRPFMNALSMSEQINAGALWSAKAIGASTGIGIAANILTGATNMLGTIADASKAPIQMHGNQSQTGVLSEYNELTYYVYRRYIKTEYARTIDSFFTMYGYKCNRLKVPNRNVRPYYTYTKTINCNITANDIPAEYITGIKEIYNSGIRFWRYRAGEVMQVGAYTTLDNSPTGA